ncbi:hypothetical protein VFPPC_16258 [Pochonia chlamydosporia 170]|uniref:Uncharacterized protein n=1 Tax=Pochonia chlamydosporia 170 TaxID=1380566 RepID=A0A179FGT4_METCM|nr:hypothetical protein VFPPC_16258 [Pochonia chlamydosporia 170]OAQ64805.1 hypothetical protein VFPPC_16258 [Pochonia chlamydosporia 170]
MDHGRHSKLNSNPLTLRPQRRCREKIRLDASIPDRFADEGFTEPTMERPAVQPTSLSVPVDGTGGMEPPERHPSWQTNPRTTLPLTSMFIEAKTEARRTDKPFRQPELLGISLHFCSLGFWFLR